MALALVVFLEELWTWLLKVRYILPMLTPCTRLMIKWEQLFDMCLLGASSFSLSCASMVDGNVLERTQMSSNLSILA
jgi:hypothetical protein